MVNPNHRVFRVAAQDSAFRVAFYTYVTTSAAANL